MNLQETRLALLMTPTGVPSAVLCRAAMIPAHAVPARHNMAAAAATESRQRLPCVIAKCSLLMESIRPKHVAK
jgi:hypothetical protein